MASVNGCIREPMQQLRRSQDMQRQGRAHLSKDLCAQSCYTIVPKQCLAKYESCMSAGSCPLCDRLP